jgi:hypothetical protein
MSTTPALPTTTPPAAASAPSGPDTGTGAARGRPGRVASAGRRMLLVGHIGLAAGWLGVTATFLVLTLWLATVRDPGVLRAGYGVHELVVTWLARPAAIGAAATGLLLALSAGRGRGRGWWTWWVPAKAALVVATVLATAPTSPPALTYAITSADRAGTAAYASVQQTLVALALYHVVMITVALGLAVFKPGRRRRG